MVKKRRPSWLKSSLRNVLTNARTSVVVTVALIPSLIAQLFNYFQSVSPLTWIVLLLCLMFTVFLLFLYFEWRALPREASGFIPGTLETDQLNRIHWVVTVVSRMGSTDPPPAVQTLIRGLPAVKGILCVVSVSDDAMIQLEQLRTWAAQQSKDLDIRQLNTRPDRLRFDESVAARLADELRHLPDADHTIIDVTADSKIMTVNLYLAAERRQLPVTYIPSSHPDHPGAAFALSVIRDPSGMFSSGS